MPLTPGVRNVWMLFTRSEDVPGKWVAHCLDLDIVTQGDSLEHAFEMAREAVQVAIDDDAKQGLNPFERPQAPPEYWARLYALMHASVPLDSVPAMERDERLTSVAAQLRLEVVRRARDVGAFVPEPWQLAALEEMRPHSSR